MIRALLTCLTLQAAFAAAPGTVNGTLEVAGKSYPLNHVLAFQPYGQNEEVWIYLTDAELPLADARNRFKPHQLASQGRFRGMRLTISPLKPDPTSLHGTLFIPGDAMPSISASGTVVRYDKLEVAGRTVSGKLKYTGETSERTWTIEAEFTSPISGSSGVFQTLTGVAARTSKPAEVFLAFEKALLGQGIEAASAFITPEKLAGMNDMLKQFGVEEFKKFQAEQRKRVLQGEARRRQIEKVTIDGDYALVKARSGPNETEESTLVKINGVWKITD